MSSLPAHIAFTEERAKLLDPLKFFRYLNEKLRILVENIGRAECYVHAANASGKTTIGGFLAPAFLRGEAHLGGVPIPVFGQPCTGALIIRRNKDGGLASIAKLREALGLWPYHEAQTAGALDYVGIFYVKPRGSTESNYKKWSRLYVFPHGSGIPEGIRIDFAWADEPPPEAMWRAIRFRWRGGGAPFCAWITATPKYKTTTEGSGWGWLMQPGEFLDCLGEVRNGRIRIQTAIYDNDYLTAADIEKAERDAATDPHGPARLLGEHVDDEGENPLKQQWAEIMRLEAMTCDPKVRRVRVTAENIDDTVNRLVIAECELEEFEPYDSNEVYIVPGDPSLGVPGGDHDPCGAHVYACRRPRLVLRYNGYVGSYGLGMLMCYLGEKYGDAWLWPLVTGGHAGPMLTAIGAYQSERHPSGYPNVGRDRNVMRPGSESGALGITETAVNKSEAIEALRKALASRRIGIPSRVVLERLKQARMDGGGRLVKGFPGQYEDFDLLSFAMHILDDNPPPDPPRRPISTAAERFLEHVGQKPARGPRPAPISGARWRR